ncbi:MAG: hypothetical protein PHI48_10910 [Bacteroidales bacterium]|nr:hypothetical protein [Bacteroidales bacterium]
MKKKFFSKLIALFAIFLFTGSGRAAVDITFSTAADPVWYFIENQGTDSRGGRFISSTTESNAGKTNVLRGLTSAVSEAMMWRVEGNADAAVFVNKLNGKAISISPDYPTDAYLYTNDTPGTSWFIKESNAATKPGVYYMYNENPPGTNNYQLHLTTSYYYMGSWKGEIETMSGWKFYPVNTKAIPILNAQITSAQKYLNTINTYTGTTGGHFAPGTGDALSTAITNAQTLVAGTPTTQELIDASAAIKTAIDAIPAMTATAAGQYFQILSVNPWDDGNTKAIYEKDNNLNWGNVDDGSANYLWEIIPGTGVNVKLKNVGTGNFVGSTSASTQVTTDATGVNYVMTFYRDNNTLSYSFTDAAKLAANTANSSLHCNNHSGTAGTGSNIVGWDGTTTIQSRWILKEIVVTNDMVLDAIANAEAELIKADVEGTETYNQIVGTKDSLMAAIYKAKVIAEGPKLTMAGYSAAVSALNDKVAWFNDQIIKPIPFTPTDGSVFVISRASDGKTLNKFGDITWNEHRLSFDAIGQAYDFSTTAGDMLGTYAAKEAKVVAIKSGSSYRLKYEGVEPQGAFSGWVRLSTYIKPSDYTGSDSYFTFLKDSKGRVSIQQTGGSYFEADGLSFQSGGVSGLYPKTTSEVKASFDLIFTLQDDATPATMAIAAANTFVNSITLGEKTFQYPTAAYNTLKAVVDAAQAVVTANASTGAEYAAEADKVNAALAAFKLTRINAETVTLTPGDIFVIERASDGKSLNKSGSQAWKEHIVSFEKEGNLITLNGTSSDFPTGRFVTAKTAFEVAQPEGASYYRLIEKSSGFILRCSGYLKPNDGSWTGADAQLVFSKNNDGQYRIGQNGNTWYANVSGEFLADADGAEAGYLFNLVTINAALEQTIADAQALIATASTVATKAVAPQVQAAITAAQAAITATASQAELYNAWTALNATLRDYSYASMKADAGKIAISTDQNDFYYTIGNVAGSLFTVTPDTLLTTAPISLGTMYQQVFKFVGSLATAKIVDQTNGYYIGKVGGVFTMVSTADSASVFAVLANAKPAGSYALKDKAGDLLTLDGSNELYVTQYTTADALSVAIDSATAVYNTTKDGVTKGFYRTADRATLKAATELATEIRNNNLITVGDYYTSAFNTLKTAIDTYLSKQISGLLYSTEAEPVWFYIASQAGDARQDMLLTADSINPLYAAPAVYTANQMWRIETSVADSAYLINRATGAKIAIVSDYADRNWTPIINQATYAGDVAGTTVAPWKVINNGNETYSFTYTVETETYNFSLNSAVEEGTDRYAVIGSNDQTEPSFNWAFVNAIQEQASIIDSVNLKFYAALDTAVALYANTVEGMDLGMYLAADRVDFATAISAAQEAAAVDTISDTFFGAAYQAILTATETYRSSVINGLVYSTEDVPTWYYIVNKSADASNGLYLTATDSVFVSPVVYTANQMWRLDGSAAAAYVINRATGDSISVDSVATAFQVNRTDLLMMMDPATAEDTYTFTTDAYKLAIGAASGEFFNIANGETAATFNFKVATQNADDIIDSVNVKLSALIAFGDGIVNADAVNAAKEVVNNAASIDADFRAAYIAFKAASFAQLEADITEATTLLATIVQGTEPNQASKSARTALQSAIANANSVKNGINNGTDFYSNGVLFESIAKTEAAIAKFRAKVVKSAELEALIVECTDLINAQIAAGNPNQEAIATFQAAIDNAGLAATAEECAEQFIALTAARDEFMNYVGVEGVEAAGLNIYTSEKAIVVEGAEGAITITTPAGVSYQVEAQDVTTITIEAAGVYYVTANGKTVAVAVK